ncbi:MAG: class I adenylate-forming enzyme family protein [Acidimicrobiia bacterium]
MIEWLARVEPETPYLRLGERTWTYGETVLEVGRLSRPQPVAISPGRDPESVFRLLAGVSGGGAVMVPPGMEPAAPADLGGAVLVVYTSGTTGEPKGVRLTVDNLAAASAASVDHLGHGPDDVWLAAMPLHHVGGISVLVRSAYAGGAVMLQEGFDAARFAAALRGEATIASVVPTMLHRLLDADSGPYRGLRAVLVGGGPIPDGLLERAVVSGLPVLPSYGMTETFGQVATLRPGSVPARRAHPLPGLEVRIEDDGRIALRGAQVSPGYLGEPDRAGDWMVTNDLGRLDDEGALIVLGRADTVIVTGGENVDPVQVERRLAEHPGVEEALVVGLPDREWGQVLACLYSGSAAAGELRTWLGERLPGHMIPKHWRSVGGIPRTALGKPDRETAAAAFLA